MFRRLADQLGEPAARHPERRGNRSRPALAVRRREVADSARSALAQTQGSAMGRPMVLRGPRPERYILWALVALLGGWRLHKGGPGHHSGPPPFIGWPSH